jgi:hypothetical protein
MNSAFQRRNCNDRCRQSSDDCGCGCRCNSHNRCRCQTAPMDIDSHRMFGIIDSSQVEALANHFLEEYYQKVSQIGWNAVLHLYAPEATISCNTHVFSGGHEFLNALSGDYIKRANFGNLGSTWSVIDEAKMTITVFGEIQFVSFTGDCGGVGHFSDTFIIKAFPDDTYGVIQHHFYFS